MNQNNQNDQNLVLYQKLDKLDEKFDRKLDKLDTRVDNIDKGLAIYNEQLKVHIEGTIQNREQIQILKQYIDLETEKIRDDIKPINDHVSTLKSNWSFSKRIGGWISVIAAFIYLILQLLGLR